MAHHIYQTEGFIIGTSSRSEADRSILLFTRELGMMRGVATGVRLSKSKLRGHLQDYTYGKLALVKGKGVWRITDAESEDKTVYAIKQDPIRYKVYVRILTLLKRMLRGEEPHQDLFDIVKNGIIYLSKKNTVTKDDALLIESLIILRVLHSLGYVGESKSIKHFIEEEISDESLKALDIHKTEVIKAINVALRESHL